MLCSISSISLSQVRSTFPCFPLFSSVYSVPLHPNELLTRRSSSSVAETRFGMLSIDQDMFRDPSEHLPHAVDDEEANHVQGECSMNGKIQVQGPCLGLTLRKTPSFLELIQKRINSEHLNNSMTRSNDDKLKASNMKALLLKIGTWERVSKHEGDLVGKFYFAKRKMVWEFLENALLRKIEIEWCDIIGIRAITKENNEPGVLEIELNKPPNFYKEHDPQPKRHTQWKSTTDFTDGQAQTYRRHYLLFPSRTLEKLYEKLTQYDERFFQMSRKGFPSQRSPYFQRSFKTIDFSFPQSFSQNLNLQPQAIQPYFRTQDSSLPSSVMGGSVQGQINDDYHAAKRQRTTNWGQNNYILEDDYYHINCTDLVQNQAKRSATSTVTSIGSGLPNLHLPNLFPPHNYEVPQQQIPSLPHLEPNLNTNLACFPEPGNLEQAVSTYSYVSDRNVPRFVEASHGEYQENAFSSAVIDTLSTEQLAESSLHDYYSSFYGYDETMQGLDFL